MPRLAHPRRRLVGFCALLLALRAGVALAEPISSNIDAVAFDKSPQGAWATYVMTFKGPPTSSGTSEDKHLRYTMVKKTARERVLENEIRMSIGTTVMTFNFTSSSKESWEITTGTIRYPDGTTTRRRVT
jgi:hypothetical protein